MSHTRRDPFPYPGCLPVLCAMVSQFAFVVGDDFSDTNPPRSWYATNQPFAFSERSGNRRRRVFETSPSTCGLLSGLQCNQVVDLFCRTTRARMRGNSVGEECIDVRRKSSLLGSREMYVINVRIIRSCPGNGARQPSAAGAKYPGRSKAKIPKSGSAGAPYRYPEPGSRQSPPHAAERCNH